MVDISNNLVDIWFFFWWSIFDKTPLAALHFYNPSNHTFQRNPEVFSLVCTSGCQQRFKTEQLLHAHVKFCSVKINPASTPGPVANPVCAGGDRPLVAPSAIDKAVEALNTAVNVLDDKHATMRGAEEQLNLSIDPNQDFDVLDSHNGLPDVGDLGAFLNSDSDDFSTFLKSV